MRSPSTIGVGEAWLFFAFSSSASCSRNTSTSSAGLPVSTSKASRRSDVSFFTAVAVVSQTRPPATTGDDQPRPGTGTFHAMFFDSLHSSGTPRSVDSPWPPGPRNCGQSCAHAESAAPTSGEQAADARIVHAAIIA